MKRFQRSGFGVMVAIASGVMAAYMAMTTSLHLIHLQGHMVCGNHLNSLWGIFPFAIVLIIFSALGWGIACLSEYGVALAQGVVFGAVAVWLISYVAAQYTCINLWQFRF